MFLSLITVLFMRPKILIHIIILLSIIFNNLNIFKNILMNTGTSNKKNILHKLKDLKFRDMFGKIFMASSIWFLGNYVYKKLKFKNFISEIQVKNSKTNSYY
jgi:hypothetical protein